MKAMTPSEKKSERAALRALYSAREKAGVCMNCGKPIRNSYCGGKCRPSERAAAETEFHFMKRGGPDR